jgi:D-alanine--poly(phosphoribitol) ligase subunit 1
MQPLVKRVLDVAARWPEQIAVETGGKKTSYHDFAQTIKRLARRFASLDAAPRIAICARKNADVYAAMFASMAAGGFYVPINPEAANSRIETVLDEVRPHAIFVDATQKARISELAPDLSYISAEDADTGEPTLPETQPHRLAYIIYTSGSTGRPKGVMISQASLDAYCQWAVDAMQMGISERMSQHPNIGFDLSVLDIYASLCSGSTLVPLDDKLDRLFPARAIVRHKLTVWNSVPSVMGMMLSSGDWERTRASSLRLMTFCGEPLLPIHLEGIFSKRPDMIVHNTYGPTEATVSCSLVKLTLENYRAHCRESASFGNPIPGTSFRIDGGHKGELLIAGNQLADGYWRDEPKTMASFVFLNGQRFYRTGDYVEQTPNGLFFVERRDHQVKIKGYRIELGEISAKLRDIAGTHAETIVDGQHIISFVEGNFSADDIAKMMIKLEKTVESYMVPQRIVPLQNFPRNDNDKIAPGGLKHAWAMTKDNGYADDQTINNRTDD